MKNINQWTLIPSLVAIAGCLALSQFAQAEPAFHGTLTIRVDGDIMAMGGATLGEAAMLMLPATGEVVGQGTGDFAALKIKRGDPVAFSATMLMPPMAMGPMEMPGTSETFTFASDSGLSVTSDGVTFSSTGPNDLQIQATVMVMDMSKPGYGMANGELNGYFTSNEEGVVSGWFTIEIPTARGTADKEVKKLPFPTGMRP